ncbi:hypothetical protein ACG7TL_006673 [Trametes sanguinea]
MSHSPPHTHLICASSTHHFTAAATKFIISSLTASSPLAVPQIPIIHLADPSATIQCAPLIRCLAPLQAVGLQCDHLHHYGAVHSLLTNSTSIKAIHILFTHPHRSPMAHHDFLAHFLAPLLHNPFPHMPAVITLSLHFDFDHVALPTLSEFLDILLPSFPSLALLQINVQPPSHTLHTPRAWFNEIITFMESTPLPCQFLLLADWVFIQDIKRFHHISTMPSLASSLTWSLEKGFTTFIHIYDLMLRLRFI